MSIGQFISHQTPCISFRCTFPAITAVFARKCAFMLCMLHLFTVAPWKMTHQACKSIRLHLHAYGMAWDCCCLPCGDWHASCYTKLGSPKSETAMLALLATYLKRRRLSLWWPPSQLSSCDGARLRSGGGPVPAHASQLASVMVHTCICNNRLAFSKTLKQLSFSLRDFQTAMMHSSCGAE